MALQSSTPTRNGFGEAVDVWSTYATVWAEITPMSGREYVLAKQRDADLTTRIRIRHRSDVLARHRVLFGARVFDIDAVLNVGERQRELQLMCREVL